MTGQEKNRVGQILKNFDFERVHEVMEHLNWTWGVGEIHGVSSVPTIKEMKNCAEDLFSTLLNSTDYFRTATGGFCAERDQYGRLKLSFQVEDYEEYK